MPERDHIAKRFLIIDDHPLIRSALGSVLNKQYADPVIHESVDGSDLKEKLANGSYDLIITDIQMPNADSLHNITYICINYPAIPVLVYSMTPENIYAMRALKAGAKGFVSKQSGLEELKRAIQLAITGKTYISQDVADLLSQQQFKKTENPFTTLSPREFQIATLLLEGKTVSEISKSLFLQNSTIGTHKGKIYHKLKVSNLIELKEMADVYKF
jgi:two-component system invasion response regulator UvrY